MSKLPVYEGTAIRENPPAYAHAVSAVPIGTAPTLAPIPIPTHQQVQNEERARQFLTNKGWPEGLQNELIRTTHRVKQRYFIIDDSGSMSINDGNRIEITRHGAKVLKCSRWAELKQSIEFHAELADILQAPTEFRLLNGSAPINIGHMQDDGQSRAILEAIMENGPRGGTPLCRHIREVANEIRQKAAYFRQMGHSFSVTVFTDGEASDGTMSNAMRLLEGMPVWAVARLCTDDDNIVSYWNDIDQNIELEMDVLDDLFGECDEVMVNNDWLVYGEPLHRFREFGTPRKELDLLDEALLGADQMRATLAMVLGGQTKDYPHPLSDMNGLVEVIQKKLRTAPKTFSPRTRRQVEWIDTSKLVRRYGNSSCSIM